MNNDMHLSFQVKSLLINFNFISSFCVECESLLKEEISIYKQESFCLKCSKINANQNDSFNKPIYNTCNVINAGRN